MDRAVYSILALRVLARSILKYDSISAENTILSHIPLADVWSLQLHRCVYLFGLSKQIALSSRRSHR